MKIKFIDRGDYSQAVQLERFSQYAGLPPEESEFYLNAAVQMVEIHIDKSLASHKIHASIAKGHNIVNLCYGPIVRLNGVWRISDCGNLCPVHLKCTRLVNDKLFLPHYNDSSWEVEYQTDSIDIGPTEELVIFEIADKLANGEKPKGNMVRSMLEHHKTTAPIFSKLRT